MLTWLARLVADKVEREVKASLRPLPSYLRRLGGGLVVLIVSTLAWATCFLFLALALFFNLATYTALVGPALWCALFSFVLGVILTVAGSSFLRPPR